GRVDKKLFARLKNDGQAAKDKYRNLFLMFGYVAAALVIVGVVWFKWYTPAPERRMVGDLKEEYLNDILPGGEKATLILSDGTQVDLGTATQKQTLSESDGTDIINNQGILN